MREYHHSVRAHARDGRGRHHARTQAERVAPVVEQQAHRARRFRAPCLLPVHVVDRLVDERPDAHPCAHPREAGGPVRGRELLRGGQQRAVVRHQEIGAELKGRADERQGVGHHRPRHKGDEPICEGAQHEVVRERLVAALVLVGADGVGHLRCEEGHVLLGTSGWSFR